MRDRDPGYDDWFDEPEAPTRESGRPTSSSAYDEPAEDVWVLPEDETRRARRSRGAAGDIVIGSVRLTRTQAAIIVAALLAFFIGILAAAGVFSSNSRATAPPITTTKLPTTPTTTATVVTATAPTKPLRPGDTGPQVKLLQKALNALGYHVGKPDGDYGPNTQSAVQFFQTAHGLTADGIVGAQTLKALRQALGGG